MIPPDRGWVSRESAGLDEWHHCRGAYVNGLVGLARCNRIQDRPTLVCTRWLQARLSLRLRRQLKPWFPEKLPDWQ